MNKKNFSAAMWLRQDTQKASPSELLLNPDQLPQDDALKNWQSKFPSFQNRALKNSSIQISNEFQPSRFLTPGWRGDSLPCKNIVQFLRIFDELKEDAREQLINSRDFNRSLRLGIFNEFLTFAHHQGLNFENVDDPTSFWKEIQSTEPNRNPAIDSFLDVFCYRTILIVFLKIRFIALISQTSDVSPSEKSYLYPSGFLSQLFKKGSSLELKSRALESNVFSWYRPRETFQKQLFQLSGLSLELSISEIIKNTSNKVQGINQNKKIYSHALSHVNFGLFLNSLLINMPLWLETFSENTPNKNTLHSMEIISSKYIGDYLESLAVSHWLAQENNKKMKWDQILCPDFKGSEFTSGLFMKICHELQFMSFLVGSSEHQGIAPIPYIAQVMGAHFNNRKNSNQLPNKTAPENSPFFSSTYDRIILNLNHLPKNNPHHYLFSQIQDQITFLKQDGYLFVLCQKDLFIQSQKEKIDVLLQQLDLKCILDLDNVKGKGELANRIYVFQKRKNMQIALGLKDKMPCYYWRFHAEMTSFHHFADITEVLRSFYLSNIGEAPSLFQIEKNDLFRLEFFQDAILDGHLIHSSSPNNQTITHPHFFNKLVQSTSPLDKNFEIREVTDNDIADSKHVRWNQSFDKNFPFFIKVLNNNNQEMKLSVHPMNEYPQIKDPNSSDCSFFRIISKNRDHDPLVLNRYFQSSVGHQLIQLGFSSFNTKIKSQLSKILIPHFFSNQQMMDQHVQKFLTHFNPTSIGKTSSQELNQHFSHLMQNFEGFYLNAPVEVLSTLHRFELALSQDKTDNEFIRNNIIQFDHPILKKKLEGIPTVGLFPNHPDVFIEFAQGINSLESLQNLTQVKLNSYIEKQITFYTLELHNESGVQIKLHSEELMLQFIYFILKNAINFPIPKIIKALRLPSLSQLKSITQIDTSNIKIKEHISFETNKVFNEVFQKLMFL